MYIDRKKKVDQVIVFSPLPQLPIHGKGRYSHPGVYPISKAKAQEVGGLMGLLPSQQLMTATLSHLLPAIFRKKEYLESSMVPETSRLRHLFVDK